MWPKITAKRGIICGTNAIQEWLLPWWWERYTAHHDYPVTFCDFGMTEKAKKWCQERGELISIEPHPVTPKEELELDKILAWEEAYTKHIWPSRSSWFLKPKACLQSTYERAIWLDLDCEILQPIDALFSYCDVPSQLGMHREFPGQHLPRFHPSVIYNGGVIVFEHGAPIIEKWNVASQHVSHLVWGDDQLISDLIREENLEIFELPSCYNWRFSHGIDISAKVVHWIGAGGKEFIQKFGGFKPLLNSLFV